jgi:hypothetical protein
MAECWDPSMLYVDDIDIGEEVEVEAKATKKRKRGGEAEGKGATKRKRKVLTKKEKARVMLSLCDINMSTLLEHVNTAVKERHIIDNPNKLEFWNCLGKSEALLKALISSLSDTFANLYRSCDKGKDKYMNFQLEWHRYCSVFLLPVGKDISDVGYDIEKHSELASLQQRWIGFCEGKAVGHDTRCSVMISLSNVIYKHFLRVVSTVQESLLDSTSEAVNVEPDSDSVYYRFCGAAIADMLHERYSKRQKFNTKPCSKLAINQEIQVLKCIQCVKKDHIPRELQYRDNGHMYFPAVEFLPFLRALDCGVMENANSVCFKKYGSHLIEVAVMQLQANQDLIKQFTDIVTGKLLEKKVNVEQLQTKIQSVYKELSRKLCHTRLAEFLTATQQTLAAQQGKCTLAGQNLRDQLLCFHVNTKSQV